MKFNIGDVEKNNLDSERYITITMSNSYVKLIKSAVESYQGDKDDPRFREKMEALRDDWHQVWRKINPS